MKQKLLYTMLGAILLAVFSGIALTDGDNPILPPPSNTLLSIPTVPANGDLNPYGVAFVPGRFPAGGLLHPGDIVVSNFNNSANTQGTGTTIVSIAPTGVQSLFFQGPQGLGLTTALGVLRRGFVLVGNVPSPTGSCTEGPLGQESGVGQGSLLVIDRHGSEVRNLASAKLLDGPWDLTIHDEGEHAQVFVSNVLSGTVTRLDLEVPEHGRRLEVESATQIASGYAHRCDMAALVVGPTGLAYDAERDVLYVASTGDNAVYVVRHARHTRHDAGTGAVIYKDNVHLHGPLAMALAPNGDLIAAQGDAVNPDPNQQSEIVEFTPRGQFVSQFSVDPAAGSAFGLAFGRAVNDEGAFRFAAVDDGTNMLDIWTIDQ